LGAQPRRADRDGGSRGGGRAVGVQPRTLPRPDRRHRAHGAAGLAGRAGRPGYGSLSTVDGPGAGTGAVGGTGADGGDGNPSAAAAPPPSGIARPAGPAAAGAPSLTLTARHPCIWPRRPVSTGRRAPVSICTPSTPVPGKRIIS